MEAGTQAGKPPKAPSSSIKQYRKKPKAKSANGSPEYEVPNREELRDHLNLKKSSKDLRNTIDDIKKDKRSTMEPDLYEQL